MYLYLYLYKNINIYHDLLYLYVDISALIVVVVVVVVVVFGVILSAHFQLPARFSPNAKILLVDPMLATGGTMSCAVSECLSRGAVLSNIRCVVAVCCPASLQKLNDKFPKLIVYAAAIDEQLDERGYIVPGLGDAGDRSFGTLD